MLPGSWWLSMRSELSEMGLFQERGEVHERLGQHHQLKKTLHTEGDSPLGPRILVTSPLVARFKPDAPVATGASASPDDANISIDSSIEAVGEVIESSSGISGSGGSGTLPSSIGGCGVGGVILTLCSIACCCTSSPFRKGMPRPSADAEASRLMMGDGLTARGGFCRACCCSSNSLGSALAPNRLRDTRWSTKAVRLRTGMTRSCFAFFFSTREGKTAEYRLMRSARKREGVRSCMVISVSY